jgi:hypothetical protein
LVASWQGQGEPGVGVEAATPLAAAGRARRLIERRAEYRDPITDLFVERLRRKHGESIVAIVFYGSCLAPETRKPTSFYDFFVVVDSYGAYHDQLSHRLLGPILPPSVFYAVFPPEGDAPALRCKYCVVSVEQLREETGPDAHDIHIQGRFSKRIAVLWSRDRAAFQSIVDCSLAAVSSLFRRALVRLPTQEAFSLEELTLATLGISYDGEQRVREASKVQALFEAEREHYLAVVSALLEMRMAEEGDVVQLPGNPALPPLFRHTPRLEDWLLRKDTDLFLWKSRVRGRARWPKYVFTVDNWLDIVLDKVERHNGVKVELSPAVRRWPLILGWPTFFRLLREGVIR